MDSLVALFFIAASTHVTEGVVCDDVEVIFVEANKTFPPAACCMFNAPMCLWQSVGEPGEVVSQRVVTGTGLVISDVTNFGQYNCTSENGIIEKKILYLPDRKGQNSYFSMVKLLYAAAQSVNAWLQCS